MKTIENLKICAKWRLAVQSSNDREVIYPNRMRYFLSASCVWQLQLFLSWIMWLTVLYLLSLCLIFLFGLQWCFSANRLITVTCHWIQMESKKHGSTRTVQSSQLNELTVTIRKKTITKKKCLFHNTFYAKLSGFVVGRSQTPVG